jgi:hypothetical protein
MQEAQMRLCMVYKIFSLDSNCAAIFLFHVMAMCVNGTIFAPRAFSNHRPNYIGNRDRMRRRAGLVFSLINRYAKIPNVLGDR